MKQIDFEGLCSYSIMKEFGDEEILKKVTDVLVRYNRAVQTGENKDKFVFDIIERDEERPNRFDMLIIIDNTGETTKKVEIATNFDLENSMFKHTLPGQKYKIVTLEEAKQRRLMDEPTIETIQVERTDEPNRPNIISTRGTVFKKALEVKRCEKVDFGESQNE